VVTCKPAHRLTQPLPLLAASARHPSHARSSMSGCPVARLRSTAACWPPIRTETTSCRRSRRHRSVRERTASHDAARSQLDGRQRRHPDQPAGPSPVGADPYQRL